MDAPTPWQVGRRIAAARAMRDWSQEVLAAKAGIDRNTVSAIEGGGNCSIRTMQRIAAAFNVPISALIDGDRPTADSKMEW